jgi:hypothetical protein
MRPAIIGAVLLAVLGAGLIFQAPSALADDSGNPFLALWDAIFSLQSKDEDLQDQIDELRAGQRAQIAQVPELVSDLYAEINVEATEDGHTLVYVKAGNAGQDRADEVKLTAFYLMPLFEINSIDSNSCEDKSRGIIECSLGVLESNQETTITIDATARESGEANTWTVDISSSTEDSDFSNNHLTYDFETGSGEQVEVQDDESVDVETQGSVSASETEMPQVISDDPATNETSSENPASDEAEESLSSTAEDLESDNEAQAESTEPAPAEEQTQDQSTSEESGADQSPEQDTNSESTGNEDTGQAVQEEPSEEQNESSEQSASASEKTQSP